MDSEALKTFMDGRVTMYNRPDFIGSDPILIPHRFSAKEDKEISAFLAATIAWGKRSIIISNAEKLMDIMENQPHAFITQASDTDLVKLESFVHRTFNATDLLYFVEALRQLYKGHGGLEGAFSSGFQKYDSTAEAIASFRALFLSFGAPERTGKHVANPLKGSSAKRLNMFLRWMVRDDKAGVDLGIWKSISPASLMLPLDVHTGNVARKTGLLVRTQDDWKAVEEVTSKLRQWDPEDPVKYDFALFGLGIFEGY